jgi:hypothetical protein
MSMKKIISLLILSVICLSAYTQGGWTKPNNSYGSIDNRKSVDSTFLYPTGCGTPISLKAYNLKKAALYLDSCNHKFWFYDPKLDAWDTLSPGSGSNVKAGFAMTKSIDTLHMGGLAPGIVHIWFPNNFDPAKQSGFFRLVNLQNSDSLNGYGPFTGGRFLTNEGLQQNDPTYSQSMISATRVLAEEYGDTARSQYGAIVSLYQRRVLDSTGGIFGPSATKKYFANSAAGVFVTNQMFPPKDTMDFFAGGDGHSSSSFESNWGFGGSWGYNVHVISGVPGYPLNAYSSHLDLQREASRTRFRSITGNGVSSYVSDYRDWQQTMMAATPAPAKAHYISKISGFTDVGNTDQNTGTDLTKAQILLRVYEDTVSSFVSMPLWKSTSPVRNGYSFRAMGDSDMLYSKGYVYLGASLPTHDNGLWPQYRFTLNGDGNTTGSMWFNPQTGRVVGSSGTPTLGSPGTFYFIAADTSVVTYLGQLDQKGANIKITGNNTSDAVRGGIDLGVHWGQNANAPVRIKFQNFDGSQENRYLFRRDKFYAEVKDSISMQAPAYKLAGMPTGAQAYVLMQDATGYTYKADTSGVFSKTLESTLVAQGSIPFTANRTVNLAANKLELDSGRLVIRGKNYTYDTLFKVSTPSYEDGFSVVRENNSTGITAYARNFASGNFTATNGAGSGFTGGIVQFSGAPIVAYQSRLEIKRSYLFVDTDPNNAEMVVIGNDTLSTGPYPWLDSTKAWFMRMKFRNHNNNADSTKFGFRADGHFFAYQLGAGAGTKSVRYDASSGEITYVDTAQYGTYNPTVTGGANYSSSSSVKGKYQRIGNIVTVTISGNVTPTATSTAVVFDVSLPISSNFTDQYDAVGGGAGSFAGSDENVLALANTTDDRIQLSMSAVASTSARYFAITIQYEVK